METLVSRSWSGRVKAIVGAVVLAVLCQALGAAPAHAATPTVKLLTADGADAWSAELIEVGTEEDYKIKVTGGSVESVTWKSERAGVATVSGDDDGAAVNAVAEGSSLLTVTVVTNNGTATDSFFVSAAADIPDTRGAYLRVAADLLLASDDRSVVRKRAAAGLVVTVTQSSGNYYLVRVPDDYDFADDIEGRAVFVLKSAVRVPPTSVTVDTDYLTLVKGDKQTLRATVARSYADDYSVSWSSADKGVAEVSSAGGVTAANEGASTVSVSAISSHDVVVTDKTIVSVYKPMSVGGVAASAADVLKAATASPALASVSSGESVKVVGSAGSYYLVTIANGVEGFVLKSRISIPISSIVLDPTAIRLKPGKTKQLTATVGPAAATDTTLTWKVRNPSVAKVSSSGLVTGKKVGKTVVTVSSRDGRVVAQATVTVATKDVDAAAPAPTAADLDLRLTSTGAKQNKLTYRRVGGATFYVLQQRPAKGKYSDVNGQIVTASAKTVAVTVPKLGTVKYYRVIGYSAQGGGVMATSSVIKVVSGRVQLSADSSAAGRITLRWEPSISDVAGYRIYRRSSGVGPYKRLKDVAGVSRKAYTDRSISSGKTYRYRVVGLRKMAHGKGSGPLTYSGGHQILSNTAKGRTASQVSSRHARAGRAIEALTGGAAYGKGVNVNRVGVKNAFGEEVHPYVKYKYAGSTLQIHLYLQFQYGSPARGDAANAHYRSEFLKGLRKGYSNLEISGSKDNFGKNVSFRTKLVIHQNTDAGLSGKQRFILVQIGGTDIHKNWQGGDSNWYYSWAKPDLGFASATDFNALNDAPSIFMPYPSQVRRGWSPKFGNDYRATAAHEMGHVVGLDDAYLDTANGASIDRMNENRETTVRKARVNVNLMKTSYHMSHLLQNDLEMVLHAFGVAANSKNLGSLGLQHYKSYSDQDGRRMTLSERIRNRSDYNDRNPKS